MRKDAVTYLADQLENAPDVAIEAIVKDPIARSHMLNLLLEEITGDDRAVLVSWGGFLENEATDKERNHWQIWAGKHGGWVTVSFLYKGTYGASLKDAPPGLKVIARYAPEMCTAHLSCLSPQRAYNAQSAPIDEDDMDEDAYDEQYEAMDYDHLNHPGR